MAELAPIITNWPPGKGFAEQTVAGFPRTRRHREIAQHRAQCDQRIDAGHEAKAGVAGPAGARAPVALEMPRLEALAEPLGGAGVPAGGRTPITPGGAQFLDLFETIIARAGGLAALVDETSDGVLIGETPSVASSTAGGRARPIRCHSRQPSMAQARMPGHSGCSFSARSDRASRAGC